jgi:hypothetical protein
MANLLSSTIGGHFYGSNNQSNILLKTSGNAGDGGILLQNSAGAFKFQIYGNATDYGFLDGAWADWDIRKTINGKLYLNGTTSYYLQTDAHSYLSTLDVGDASNGVSLNVGNGSAHGVYTLDNARNYLVVAADYYPHMALVASGSNNTTHGAVFSFVGTEGSSARQWNIGIPNQNPFIFSIGYNRTGDPNPHYGVGDEWSSEDYNHARLSIDRDGNTKIRGMLYVNGTSGGISTGSAVIHSGNIASQSVDFANRAEFQTIPDHRGNAYVPNDYAGNRVWWHFNNTDTVGGYGTYWNAIQTVSPWSGYDSSHRQQQIQWGGTDISFRYATSGTTWSSWFRFITDANIGAQSVSYAASAGVVGTADYAVTAGALTSMDISQFTNDSGYITSVGNITKLWAESHPTDYYVRANWTGSYWQLTSNHPSPVQVGYADNADALSGLGVGSFLRDDGWNNYPGQDANTQEQMRVDFTYSNNAPYTGELIRFGSSGYSTQFNTSYGNSDNFAFRTRNGDNGTWNPWKTVIHSGNIGSQSVDYALNSTRLYASDAPYTFGGGAPYYMYMTYDGSRWLLQVTPGTPAAVRVSYADSAGSAGSAPNGSNLNASYGVTAGAGNGLKFWGGEDTYKISMGNSDEYHYGPVTDYSIKTVIDSVGATRGFTWGVNGGTPIAALNVGNGNMQIAGSFTTTNINAPSGYISNGNPWGTANSAYFPNGITTAGSDNWIYGHTFVGNAPTNGNGHEFWADGNMKSTGHHYLDANYGQTIVGRYSSTVYQGVWAMGDSYKLPIDGSTTGSLYGLAWSHPNAGGVAGNLNTHGLLVMENGTFLAAISGSIRSRDDMRAPIFYDSEDTEYYLDPNGTSNLNKFSGRTMAFNDMNPMSVNSPYVDRYNGSTAYRNGTMGYGSVDFNTIFSNWGSGFIDTWGSPANAPGGSSHYVGLQGFHYNYQDNQRAYGFQMACAGEADNKFFWRSGWPNLRSWVEMIHSGNIGGQSVDYASSAGSASSSSNSNHLNTTRDTPSNSLQYWQAPSLGINEAPSLDWHNTIRMGHGSPLSYYSNTLAVRMTGSGVGDIYTQTIMNGSMQGWKKHWNDGNMDAPNKSGTSYYQTNTWMQFNGDYGLYWPSNYGAHFHGK